MVAQSASTDVEEMTLAKQNQLKTTCCVVGGGPAGMMLGYLLARAGIDVQVLEKHSDFLRDFRGDTVHPSTLNLLDELGILKDFLALPFDKTEELGGQIGDDFIVFADFRRINAKCKFVAFTPQWHFLNFLAEKAAAFPGFHLQMDTEATDLIEENGKVVGVKAETKSGSLTVKADLVVAADGRASLMREKAGFKVIDVGAPMDVLWMRLSRKETDPPQTLGRIQMGLMFIMLNRHDYWQCGFVIPKGKLEDLKSDGLDKLCQRISSIAPFMSDRVEELKSWDDIKLLTVKVDHLEKWYRDGLICIGDSAHAMSPVGGVGINLAIQDAVAASNYLQEPLKHGCCDESDLARVQKWRMYPTRMTQRLQVAIQNAVIKPTLESAGPVKVPAMARIFQHVPAARALPATIIGIGFRPEHIRPIPLHHRCEQSEKKPASVG